MYDPALVAESHVRACEDVVGDGLTEDFDAEDVCDSNVCKKELLSVFSSFLFVTIGWIVKESAILWMGEHSHLLRLPLDIRVYEGHMVVTTYDISKCR